MRISFGFKNRLGRGRHGEVYVATVTMAAHSKDVGRVYALKKTRVTNHVRHPMLLHEACALVLLRGRGPSKHPNIPDVFAWGRSQYFEYLVMDRLGSNLEETIKTMGANRLTLRNLVVLVCQTLDVIEYVHEKGIVHCDVKLLNFVLGTGKNAGRLYLIDWGLSRSWIDHKVGKPIPEDANFGFRGTLHFASRNVHLGCTPSRRDDVESLAYVLVKLLTGALPWAHTKERDEVLPILFAHDGKTLCKGYHDVFAQFVDYARGLQYDETPTYQSWRQAFRALIPGLSADAMFDPEDNSEPRVGTQESLDPVPPCKVYPTRVLREDSDPELERVYGGASKSSSGGEHSFTPNWGSSWSRPSAIRVHDLFGDEFAIVKGGGLEFIDAPPDYSRGTCTYPGFSPKEVMKNDQSDSRCI